MDTQNIIKQNTVSIHNKDYLTVAGKLKLAHQATSEPKAKMTITTEVLVHEPKVVIKATVTTAKGSYTGISAANPEKMIEKLNPYEVAETSAVGRALTFAGFGVMETIASAEEMIHTKKVEEELFEPPSEGDPDKICPLHGVEWKTFNKEGRSWEAHPYKENGVTKWHNIKI